MRGGGESGLGRSSGAGALMALAFSVGSSGSVSEDDAPMSNVMGCALTNSDEAEPGGSENGSVLWA